MATANSDMRDWLSANGHAPPARGKIPAAKAEIYYAEFPEKRPPGSVALLPSPEEAWAADGDWDDIGLAEAESDPGPPREPRRYEAVPDEPETVTADSGPAHGRKEWRKEHARETPRRQGAPRKPSVTVRTDINAKISLALEVPGRVWQARDPVCGGAFIEQRPAISDALTEIVCNSPDLVAWFAGQGGQFMVWFNLAMCVWPVITVIMAHHVYHTVQEYPEGAQQPDYQDYAA